MLYRSVYELHDDEINELKEKLFDGCYECGNLDLDETELLNNIECVSDIPVDFVYSAFGGYDFVTEDFFCNTNKNFGDLY